MNKLKIPMADAFNRGIEPLTLEEEFASKYFSKLLKSLRLMQLNSNERFLSISFGSTY